MTNEEKELLFKDLCARLPYGVKAQHNNKKEIFGVVEQIEAEGDIDLSYYNEETEKWKLCCTTIDNIKPYLRPMSSMTKEEAFCYNHLDLLDYSNDGFEMPNFRSIDWLNSHHFDFRNLIEKGLALEATEEMYKTE